MPQQRRSGGLRGAGQRQDAERAKAAGRGLAPFGPVARDEWDGRGVVGCGVSWVRGERQEMRTKKARSQPDPVPTCSNMFQLI